MTQRSGTRRRSVASRSSSHGTPPAARGRRSRRALTEMIAGYAFASPALFLFALFVGVPLVGSFVLSFAQWDLLSDDFGWVGGANYAQLASDESLPRVLLNSLVFALATATLHLVLGLLIAMAVNAAASRFVQAWATVSYVFPFFVSAGAAALLARYLLSPDFGPVSYYLGRLGIDAPNWLSDPDWALPSLVVLDLWQTVGFTFLIFLVGLQGIPKEYYEAAKIDGAGAFRRFFTITLPMVSPTTLFAMIVSFAGAFQIFTWPYIVTAGGPGGATRTIVYYIYERAFRGFDIGYGAALGVLTIVILALVTVVQLVSSKKWVHYER